MQNVLEQLKQNLQIIYRKAIDADAALSQLQQQGKGKFATIFDENSPFTTRAKRFEPYVQEVAGHMDGFVAMDFAATPMSDLQPQLTISVQQIEALLATLAQFKATLK